MSWRGVLDKQLESFFRTIQFAITWIGYYEDSSVQETVNDNVMILKVGTEVV